MLWVCIVITLFLSLFLYIQVQWNRPAFVLIPLTYFTLYDSFYFYPSCSKKEYFIFIVNDILLCKYTTILPTHFLLDMWFVPRSWLLYIGALNIVVHVSFRSMFLWYGDRCQGMKSLDHVVLILLIIFSTKLFSIELESENIPTTVNVYLFSPHPHQHSLFLDFWI